MFRSIRNGSRTLLFGLAICAAIALAACGSSASLSAVGGNAAPVAAPTAAPTAAAAKDANETAGDGSGTSTPGGIAAVDPQHGPLIIRTGSVQLEVKDLDATLLQARARIVGLGGYVSDSERTNAGDKAAALITYRIPAARWDEALDALHGLATKVLGEQTKANDVTGQVFDLGARIDNLRATERALQAIMAQATKISDILDVQNQLTTVRGQIEQLSTQQAHLNDQAALGTLAVAYSLPVVAVAQVSSDWSLAAEFDKAAAQLVQVGQGLAVLLVWLGVVGLPVLIGLVVVAWLALQVARRLGLTRPAASPPGGWPTATR
jgi:hypothetical protein